MAATKKTTVNRSASVSLADVTVDEIVAAASKVGAPSSAKVTTGAGFPVGDGQEYLPYSLTFSWGEEV